MEYVTLTLKPRANRLDRHIVDELIFRLNSMLAQLYNVQEEYESSVRFLDAAMEHADMF